MPHRCCANSPQRQSAKAEGGDTDTSRDYEYTEWAAVDRFAVEFVEDVTATPAAEAPVVPPRPTVPEARA